jgi:hypothetical protein
VGGAALCWAIGQERTGGGGVQGGEGGERRGTVQEARLACGQQRAAPALAALAGRLHLAQLPTPAHRSVTERK